MKRFTCGNCPWKTMKTQDGTEQRVPADLLDMDRQLGWKFVYQCIGMRRFVTGDEEECVARRMVRILRDEIRRLRHILRLQRALLASRSRCLHER